MKVFISWSGSRSRELAFALREWLPLVLQYVEPWVSEKDISAGDRWARAIAGELETSNFGIICVTPENLASPWILFEAGALSKSMLDGKVIPLLFGLELSELGGPLSQFQAQKAEQDGVTEIIRAINKVSDTKAADATIDQLIPALWPLLATKMAEIPEKVVSEKHMRPQHEILEELVAGVRSLTTRIGEFDSDLRDLRYVDKRGRDFHPGMLEDIFETTDSREDRGASLLVLAGMVREPLPWMAELMVESYRELRSAGPEEIKAIAFRLHKATRSMLRGPMASGLTRTKMGHMLAMELPHLIDRAIMPLVDIVPGDEAGKSLNPKEEAPA